MSIIRIKNLTFCYDGGINIFEDLSLKLDTDWKLGVVGRNGRGKTTFLKLLADKFVYGGVIDMPVKAVYFPFEIDGNQYLKDIFPVEDWKMEKELNLLEVDLSCIYRPFSTLSGGEKTKAMLAMLFCVEQSYVLLDEPTNHLDAYGKKVVADYLKTKSGFAVVSHDSAFLDRCTDHTLSLNKTGAEISSVSFGGYFEERQKKEKAEIAENRKLKAEIDRLKEAADEKSRWAASAEKRKNSAADSGFVSAAAARQAKSAVIMQKRILAAANEKSKLFKDAERSEPIKMFPLDFSGSAFTVSDLSYTLGEKTLLHNINLTVKCGNRIFLRGKNGSGKSTFIKLLTGEKQGYEGKILRMSGLKISYIPQEAALPDISVNAFADNCKNGTLVRTLLIKFGFSRDFFDKNTSELSEGQKKLLLFAVSLSEEAHVYIWDEPLNFVDIYVRGQIAEAVKTYCPTLIAVEHDQSFRNSLATSFIDFG